MRQHPVRFLKSLGLAALLLTVAGCGLLKSTPLPATPVPVADGFAGPNDGVGPVADQWWTRFDDPRLTALVDTAVRDNPAVGQAVAQLAQAGARARITGADRFPSVGAQLRGARQRQTLAGLGPVGNVAGGETAPAAPTAFISNNFGLSIDVSWEIDLWGRIAAQTAAARADFLASAENLRAVRQSLAAQAARGYFAVIAAERQSALSRRVVGTYQEVARQVGDRADLGIAPPNDKLLAIANLESARGTLQQRQETVKRQTAQLEVLLRQYPDGRLKVSDALPELPPPPPAGLPAELLARRPDILAAEFALRGAGFRIDAARRALLPGISLTGSFGTASNELNNVLDGDFGVWSIAGGLLQPIFQGGRLRAQVRLADAQRSEAIANYANAVLQALSEVEIALAVESDLQRSEAAYAAAANAAEQATTISFNRYRAGIDPFLNVLESERRALDARSAEIAARLARIQNRINLHLALGGGFGGGTVYPTIATQKANL